MADSPDMDSPANGEKTPSPSKPLWNKGITKVVGWLGAGLMAVITAAWAHLTPTFDAKIDQITETGDPVLVSDVNVMPAHGLEVAFPMHPEFTQADIDHLNGMTPNAQYAWLRDNKGVDVDSITINVTLVGNRSAGVHILNITRDADCQDPLHGTLFYMPPQGAEPNVGLYMNLDKSDSQTLDAADRKTPYFQEKTLDLEKGKAITITVAAEARKQYCTFSLKATVLDNGHTRTEEISDKGARFAVNGNDDPLRYDTAYMGAGFCKHLVKNDKTWFEGVMDGEEKVQKAMDKGDMNGVYAARGQIDAMMEFVCGKGNVP